MNQGPICAKVYPEGIQPIKGNNCGLIPITGIFLYLILWLIGKVVTDQFAQMHLLDWECSGLRVPWVPFCATPPIFLFLTGLPTENSG